MQFTIKDAFREMIFRPDYILVRPKNTMYTNAIRCYDQHPLSLELHTSKLYEAVLDAKTKQLKIHDHGFLTEPQPVTHFVIEDEADSLTSVLIDKIVSVALFLTILVVKPITMLRANLKKQAHNL